MTSKFRCNSDTDATLTQMDLVIEHEQKQWYDECAVSWFGWVTQYAKDSTNTFQHD